MLPICLLERRNWYFPSNANLCWSHRFFQIRLRFFLNVHSIFVHVFFRVFWTSVHRKANAALGADFQARSMSLGTTEPLAR